MGRNPLSWASERLCSGDEVGRRQGKLSGSFWAASITLVALMLWVWSKCLSSSVVGAPVVTPGFVGVLNELKTGSSSSVDVGVESASLSVGDSDSVDGPAFTFLLFGAGGATAFAVRLLGLLPAGR